MVCNISFSPIAENHCQLLDMKEERRCNTNIVLVGLNNLDSINYHNINIGLSQIQHSVNNNIVS